MTRFRDKGSKLRAYSTSDQIRRVPDLHRIPLFSRTRMRVRWFFLGVAHLPQSKPGFYLDRPKAAVIFSQCRSIPRGAASGQSICRKGEQPAAYSWPVQGGSHKPCNNKVIMPVFLFVLSVAAGLAASWQPFSPDRAFSDAPFPPDTGQNRISYRAYSA